MVKIQFKQRELKKNRLELDNLNYDYLISLKKYHNKLFNQLTNTLIQINQNQNINPIGLFTSLLIGLSEGLN